MVEEDEPSQDMIHDMGPPPISPEGSESSKKIISFAWQYFEKLPSDIPNHYFLHCLLCRKKKIDQNPFSWSKGDGTGTICRHLAKKHGLTKKTPLEQGQSQISAWADQPGAGYFTYNRDVMIDELGKLVVADDLPFSYGESLNVEHFNRIALNPQFRRVPRNTLKRRTCKQYYASRNNMIEFFRSFDGRVALTSDAWTSHGPGEPYLCITVHWIDENWFLQKRIIAFDIMEESHTGFHIKSRIISTLDEFHLRDKVFSISFDNASANTKCIDYLRMELKLLLDGIFLHVRCCAHVLNLSVQEAVDGLNDLVKPIRQCIKWMRSSINVKAKYKAWCKQNNLPAKRFCLDAPTRWNATYKMLCDAYKYKEILNQLYNDAKNKDIEMLNPQHWSVCSKLIEVLERFDSVTKTFSLVYQPNVHLVIQECVLIVDAISKREDEGALSLLLYGMKVKWLQYFGEFPYIYGIATILDPSVKTIGLTTLLEFYYTTIGFEYDVSLYVNRCVAYLYELYEIYAAIYEPQAQTAVVPASVPRRLNSRIATILKKSKSTSGSSTQFGVNEYLTCEFEIGDDYEILSWWKKNESKFSVLSKIAKDILVVPASTIASESAFSSGRRVLDEKRQSLAPESLKICVCKKDWDQAEKRTQGMKDDDDDDEDDPWMRFDTSSESGTSSMSSPQDVSEVT